MIRNILIALALLLFGWAVAGSASASQYKGYYYGAQTPTEIAVLVEQSLAIDPTGRTMLDAAKCRRDGSCAAPINYVESFRAHDPRGNVTLENLGAYLRKLRIDCTVSGVYQMDRIILRSGTLGRTDVNGMSRSFLPNECAWVNPDTGRPVLAQNCANPVGMEVRLECVYVNIETRTRAEFAVIWARYEEEDDPCFAYRRVSRLFEPDSPRALWHEVPNGCVGRPCDFTETNRSLGRQQVVQGEIPLDSPGFYQIRLSPEEFLVLCLKLRDGTDVRSSFASGVRWQQDYRLIGGEHHARVYYKSHEVETDGLSLNGPRGLTFWASDRQAEVRMHGLAVAR